MWGFGILLCAAIFTESCADETVFFGQKLSVAMSAIAKKLEFVSVDKSQNYTLWSSSQGPRKGKVEQWSSGKNFIVNSASFDDEGNYTEWSDNWSFVTTVKVLSLIDTKTCEVGQTLTISLDGLRKDDASLHFSSGALNLMLVHQGSLMWNSNFKDRIKVTSNSIQVLKVKALDVGKYTLMDGKGRPAKITTLKINDPCTGKVDVQFGHQLSIKLLKQVTSMSLTPVNKSQNYTIWSSSVKPNRGKVEGSGNNRRYVINSVTFEDQGDYTQQNTFKNGICVTKVKVLTSTDTKTCEVGQTLTIPLDVIKKNEASLRFSSDGVDLTLVTRGSPVFNLRDFSKRINVTSSSIQVSNIQVADMGNYKILDVKGRVAKITTLKVIDPCVAKVEVKYGHQLSIKLLVRVNSLGFTSMDISQNNTIWPQGDRSSRGNVAVDKRHFTVNSANFDDQGDYTQWDKQDNRICVTNVTVLTSTDTQKLVAGETLTISLDGIKENEATLHFSNKEHVDLMLVKGGSPERNLKERIRVNSTIIQVLRVNVSDVGQYALFDGKDRKAKIITLELTEPVNWKAVGIVSIIVVAVGLLGGVVFRCCWKARKGPDFSNGVL
ncbi:uncharacterized protein [Salminus brasiliensis]|uniref:uncharacterized protein isoform X1 n=2 Tax=Salminus brasiliensis TaxID=930266 RepID=UPI003B830C23